MKNVLSIPKRAVGRVVREAILYPTIITAPRGKRVAFLPSSGREQSGLLRAYLIAEHLQQQGWSTMVVPKHLSAAQRDRVLGAFNPDLVYLQMCRHPLNRMEYLHGRKLVLDVDDADFLDDRLSEVMAEVARHARGVICGSRFIRDWALQHNDHSEIIWTGSPVSGGEWPAHEDRDRVVTWAQSNPMAAESEFAFVEQVVLRAHALSKPFTFRLYGWRWPEDHPRLQLLNDNGVRLELKPPMDYQDFLLSLRDVAVGLSAIVGENFSQGKSFGKILGYLDAKVPVICSDGADHSDFFTSQSGVVSDDADVWVDQLTVLLNDSNRRQKMAENAYQNYFDKLSIEAVSNRVSAFLDRALAA